MRFSNNRKSAAHEAMTMPFAGLGFATEAVRAVAQTVSVTYDRTGSEWIWIRRQDTVAQPSGYSLLVALGREIRGR